MPIKSVDAKTLKQWIEKKQAVVIDVREPAEYGSERIDGAVLIPLAKISKHLLPDIGDKKLVIHCKAGGRSSNACKKLIDEDSNLEVYNLEGGLSAWKEVGHQIITSAKTVWSLDRQVQLTIGVCLVIASILGYLISPIYFLFTGFIGAGLIFAGVTGCCRLAMIIAKMPWNQKGDSIGNSCSR